MKGPKVYVGVSVFIDADGKMLPNHITWEDGTVYEIDKVTDIRQAASLKAGGLGDRYTVSICGKMTYLFFERCAEFYGEEESKIIGRWFVERR